MRDLRPWETKRLGPHHYVVRPWRPWEDRRVQGGVALVTGSGITAGVWHLQGDEAGMVAPNVVATLVGILLVWCWRAWRAGG